jgi:hypothetical protein
MIHRHLVTRSVLTVCCRERSGGCWVTTADWASVVIGVVALVLAAAALPPGAWPLRRRGRSRASASPASPPSLDRRVDRLRAYLDLSKALIAEINAEFDLQAAAAERIKAEGW